MSLNPEIGMFVVKWITRKGKADAVERAEGSSRRYAKVSIADTTGVLEQGMFSEGLPGNLGESVISLYRCRGRLPEKKRAWLRRNGLLADGESARNTNFRKQTRYWQASDKRSL